MFVVCTEKEQITPTLQPADPASTSGAERPITRGLPGEEPRSAARAGNAELPQTGRPCGGAGGAAQPRHRRARRAGQSEPSAQPPPALPTAQGGEQKEAITGDLAAQSGGCVTPTYRS